MMSNFWFELLEWLRQFPAILRILTTQMTGLILTNIARQPV
jgi:uncharacterized integral membrane protein